MKFQRCFKIYIQTTVILHSLLHTLLIQATFSTHLFIQESSIEIQLCGQAWGWALSI